MLEGIDVNQRIEFISSMDKTDPHTIFVLRPLTGLEKLKYPDLENEETLIDYLCISIVEIKNIDIPVKDFIKTIDLISLSELMNKIGGLNKVSEEDKKKV